MVLLVAHVDLWMPTHGPLAAAGVILGFGVGVISPRQAQDEWHRVIEMREASRTLGVLEQALALTLATKQPSLLLGEPLDAPFAFSIVVPDLAHLLARWILVRRPRRVVECGCGLSTPIIGKCLRETGGGQPLSLTHQVGYASVVRERLAVCGSDLIAQIHAAPLLDAQTAHGAKRRHDPGAALRQCGVFDLCLIDGPPAYDARQPGRSGGFYALWETAAVGAEFMPDDRAHEGERACVTEWQWAFGARMSAPYLELMKGARLLRKTEA